MHHVSTAAPAARPDLGSELARDLEVLCDGPMIDFRISFDGGLIAMRSNDKVVFEQAAEGRWMRLDGAGRARLFASWIHQAAEKYRQLLKARLGDADRVGVA